MASGFLTTQQVQDLLDVDASTIYRMAGDGRLPAVRIGRQWRFPAADIEAMLRVGGTDPDRAVPPPGTAALLRGPGATAPTGRASTSGAAVAATGTAPAPTGSDGRRGCSASAGAGAGTAAGSAAAGSVVAAPVATSPQPDEAPLPPPLAVAALEAIAPALGVAMVVTDLDGQPLTPIVNPAPAILARSQDPTFTTACSLEWRAFAHEPHLAPRLTPGRFGFLCAHSFVRSGPTLVAMVLAGGIAAPGDTDPDLYHLDGRGHRLVLETLPRTAALLSQLVALTATSTEAP